MRNLARRLVKSALRPRLGSASAEDKQRIATLKQSVARLPLLPPGNASPSAAEWLRNRQELRDKIAEEDPRRFLQWDVIRRTMFIGNPRYIRDEIAVLRTSPDWHGRWKSALNEHVIGLPDPSPFCFGSSGNLIHHAYSLRRFEQETGRRIDMSRRIVEFGGGYGSFARLAFRLGFRGTYLIVDLPEFSALQEYFLRSVGVPLTKSNGEPGVKLVTDITALGEILAGYDDWLLVALWSLSETPLVTREQVLRQNERFGGYLFAYQRNFAGMDNARFFSDWVRSNSDIRWSSLPISHMPDNQYLFGVGAG